MERVVMANNMRDMMMLATPVAKCYSFLGHHLVLGDSFKLIFE